MKEILLPPNAADTAFIAMKHSLVQIVVVELLRDRRQAEHIEEKKLNLTDITVICSKAESATLTELFGRLFKITAATANELDRETIQLMGLQRVFATCIFDFIVTMSTPEQLVAAWGSQPASSAVVTAPTPSICLVLELRVQFSVVCVVRHSILIHHLAR